MSLDLIADESLPIQAFLKPIFEIVAGGRDLILKAEPGAGKTSCVPLALMKATEREIVMLEPRRLAAKLAAARLASSLGETPGEKIGYQIRWETRCGPATRVRVITEGIFLKLLQSDPDLAQVGIVILDEFHERHIQSDVALAMLRHLQETRRPDLRIVVMSATLDTRILENYLKNASVLSVPGRAFPVAIDYLPHAENEPLEKHIERALIRVRPNLENGGDVLVFLPGIREINKVEAFLSRNTWGKDFEILSLFADQKEDKQRKIFSKTLKSKIVLATNVAESSVTIPGVTTVIDTGTAKVAKYGYWSGINVLDIGRISQASAIQRAGRAGRLGPGRCIRLYGESDFLGRAMFDTPEIERVDLAPMVLELGLLGKKLGFCLESLSWLTPMPSHHLESALEILQILGAIDESRLISEVGSKMAILPLPPRMARLVIAGRALGCPVKALYAAAILSEGYPFPVAKGGAEFDRPSDVLLQVEQMIQWEKKDANQGNRLQNLGPDVRVLQRVQQVCRNLGDDRQGVGSYKESDDAFSSALLSAFPDRVAKLQPAKGILRGHEHKRHYAFCMGRGGLLSFESVALGSEWVLALDATETHRGNDAATGTMIHTAHGLPNELLNRISNSFVSKSEEIAWDEKFSAVRKFEREFYGKLVVREISSACQGEYASRILASKLEESWPKPFADQRPLEAYHQRVALLEQAASGILGDDMPSFPVFEGELFQYFLQSICDGKSSFKEIGERNLDEWLQEQLSYAELETLDQLVPEQFRLPNGRLIKINYPADGKPWMGARIQDCFAIKGHPSILQGRIPLLVHLLAPNGRPAQITDNLPRFWQTSYQDVRKELFRRYPKHAWPEDPSQPTKA